MQVKFHNIISKEERKKVRKKKLQKRVKLEWNVNKKERKNYIKSAQYGIISNKVITLPYNNSHLGQKGTIQIYNNNNSNHKE